ncbi:MULTISPECIES: bifunctional diguanylate cyclase/phosphodiesterase [unclassified Duganella]|uniref:sensor domain-containing protein n=1 Tax=unclassified Duganella TaxID=2636909 RepID=UPI0007004888|nr:MULTISPECIES: bifunctional diguanylate cyclase/phosphodiesterase [unclassified Duganella]KQV53848.1 diguanylate cyclase [Duganella sp. Root336D2]KRB83597.1 diguanylate cyclase [Duganella sp. Root198D2]
MSTPSPAAPATPAHAALDLIARMVAALELTPLMAVCSFGRDGVVQFCNQACADMLGIEACEAVGKRMAELRSHGARQAEHDALLEEIWRNGHSSPAGDWQVRTGDGRELWLYSTHIPVWHEGQLAQIFCMEVDITQRHRDFDALQAAGENFHHLFERSSDAILLLRDGVVEEANPAAVSLFKCDGAERLVGRGLHEFSPMQQPSGVLSAEAEESMAAEARHAGNAHGEWHYVDCEGGLFWAEVLLTALSLDGSKLYYAVVRDISERKRAERKLHLAAQVFENSRDAIVLTDRSRRVIALNRAFTVITGFGPQDMLGKPVSLFRSGVHDESFYREVWAQVEAGDHWEGELWGRRHDGGLFPCWTSISSIRDSAGRVSNYMGIVTDITERKKSEEHTRHLAEHDFLTDLPNRVLLLDRLRLALAAARRNQALLAVLFVDLDRFKVVNDTLGHSVGDRLLKEVASRLVHCVREADTVSRQGGDEFIIVLSDVAGAQGAAHAADSVLRALEQEFVFGEHIAHISGSIGIAMFPADGEEIDTLLKNADIAMYHAKQEGRNGYRFFSGEMNARIVERSGLEQGLRRALAELQFELVFEPEVDIPSGAVVGMEALLRWRHPELGVLLPERFIDVATEAGLMVAVGNWVLQEACRQARGWQDESRELVVSVNLAPVQFVHKDLLDCVAKALRSAGLPPRLLELQLTEAMLMQGGTQTETILGKLRGLGVRLSIDDFGTGYSRLGQLKDSPIDKLKIAQSFFERGTDATAIRTIIAMARSLDMTVIAEGVETEAQLQLLRELGCDQYQGHLASAADPG